MSEPRERTPSSGRDAGWLVGADLVAVGLAFAGQILLAHALLTEHYGWMVLAIDLYASLFLVIDLGLPTLIARDGARTPSMVLPAVLRTYRWQVLAALPFVLFAVLATPEAWVNIDAPTPLLLAASLIALVHVASYAPRSGLRVLGRRGLRRCPRSRNAWLPSRVIACWSSSPHRQRQPTPLLFCSVQRWDGSCRCSFCGVLRRAPNHGHAWQELGEAWVSNRALLFSALPFAITLGILPYVIRIEKFMVAAQSGSEIAAVFHVAQLAWLAGLVVPAAIRSALLPVLGAARSTPIEHRVEMNRALDMCFGLLPYGLFGGYLVVWGFAPLAFPSTFFDGRYGASAVDLFAVLLGGWGLTLLATPTYTGLMAGWRPWRFTQFIVLVLLVALVVGYAFIVYAATSDGTVLFAAAWASTVSAGALLVLSWVMGDDLAFVSSRRDEWALALLGTSFVVAGLASHTAWWVFGLPLFLFTPQGWRAVRSTLA